ncbi:MAG TPA: SDR family oxidoreductase [Opitutaceae bacterium]|jgi:short-subunit dehydrogenase|nr:SDR family oxidoreductase [Opitutaceae bacterium]
MPLQNKVLWITGASSGIGEALAYASAKMGARLILSARRADELERVRLACANTDRHLALPLDLTRSATFPALVATVLQTCGHVDALINNGGISQRGLASETTTAVEREIFETDYFGPVALTKALLPSMRARQSGRVVVVSSVMGYVGTPMRSSYSAAKHALHGYFDSLRAEVWREGIRVTLVCPGYVDTAISKHALAADGSRPGSPRPRRRRGMPADRCADAILRAIIRDREEIALGGREVWGIWLQRFFPRLLARLVRRMDFGQPATLR